MNECVILVDNSNIYIEGIKYSARLKGVPKSSIDSKDPQDPSWRIDFGRLLNYLAGGRKIYEAFLVGSRPPPNDGVWMAAEENGFEVVVHDRGVNNQEKAKLTLSWSCEGLMCDRGVNNQEKAVDTELVMRGTKLIVLAPKPMTLVIASGDRDFIPLVNLAHDENWSVEMCAFSSAYSDSGEMATSVDVVRPLEEGFSGIGYYGFKWPSE